MASFENTSFKIENFLTKIPRPNINELIDLYNELDEMTKQIAEILVELPQPFYDPISGILFFERMTEEILIPIIEKNPKALIPFFTTICGLSIREFERLYNVKDVYSLQTKFNRDSQKEKKFVKIIKDLLPPQIYIETVLYKFYKNWEEHQKRHKRGKAFEESVRTFFRKNGYDCRKITSPIEVDAAIPSDNPLIVIPIRIGVTRDLVKRAKEFGSEFNEIRKYFSRAKFVVVFGIPVHESHQREIIREKIKEYGPAGGYDAIVFGDELETLLSKLEQWGIPRRYHKRK